MKWIWQLCISLTAPLIAGVLLEGIGGGGCVWCGPISNGRVADELSRHVSDDVAQRIVDRDPSVQGAVLEELSRKWFLDDDAITTLLLHPNFPQARRSEMIRKGKSAHYLPNATDCSRQSVTDEDIKAMLPIGRFGRHYLLRQALECRGLSADTYRAVYANWLKYLLPKELEDARFLVISANLPRDVKDDIRARLSHVRFPKSFDTHDPNRVGYMHVRDDWKRDCEFYILCDDFLGAGSLLEFIRKAKHYSSLEELKAAAKGKTLYKDSDFGVCSREYKVL